LQSPHLDQFAIIMAAKELKSWGFVIKYLAVINWWYLHWYGFNAS